MHLKRTGSNHFGRIHPLDPICRENDEYKQSLWNNTDSKRVFMLSWICWHTKKKKTYQFFKKKVGGIIYYYIFFTRF